MRALWRRHSIILALMAALLCVPTAVVGLSAFTAFSFEQTAQRGANTLGLAVAALRGQLARYEKLPELLAQHQDIIDLVLDPSDAARVEAMNHYLKATNALIESSDLYIMLPDGETLAASNFDLEASFVGENFAYRPYFLNAIDGGEGRFFALGVTSLKRGYYFGAPIHTEQGIMGVMVLKVDIDAIESTWRGSDYEIIVTDPEGIVFMAGRSDWLFSAIQPLTEDRLARTAETRRYANADLRELPMVLEETGETHQLFTVSEPGGAREYLAVTEPMPEADWTVKVLIDTASARAQALTTVAVMVLLIGLAAMGVIVYLQRRAQLAERLATQRQAQAELEKRVAERTADLAEVNRRLKAEVVERRSTEKQLRKTQSDLVQAGKLAALGQMSAALSHEFNQPLAAVRTYADNALVLLERDRPQEARQGIERIAGLVDRMAAISRHLRNFARKPGQKLGAVRLDAVVADASEILAWRLAGSDVDFRIDLGSEPIVVRAGAVRLQQVLVNIVSNALDAVEGQAEKRVALTAEKRGRKVLIRVSDNGPGVPSEIAARIFDPFFSTKGVGKGLGLGLSISYNIVKDFGGDLTVGKGARGGARFVIALDAARVPVREAAQ